MTRLILLVGTLVLLLAAVAVAETTDPVAPADMDDATLYRTYCKTCHDADSEAGEYAPLDLIMDQWDEFFDAIEETHAEAVLESTFQAAPGRAAGAQGQGMANTHAGGGVLRRR